VQQNCLRSLSGLQQLPNLDTLNISSNGLDSLEHLQDCPLLSTLTAEHNHLSTLQGLQPLLQCTNLHTLDLQQNNIEDPAVVDAIIAHLPQLRCLHLKGNPVVSNIKSYRKVVISRCPNLTYLDDRPVQEDERRCCEAW
jgi:dynein assembly factor 1